MAFNFGTKKSAGIRVTSDVHRLIQRGNRARDLKDWASAGEAYRAALGADPTLYHIWIQLGHSLKEVGRTDEAVDAYQNADKLRPESGEARNFIAHLWKMSNQPLRAARQFASLIAAGLNEDEAERELVEVLKPVATFSSAQIRSIMRYDSGDCGSAPVVDLAEAASVLDNVLHLLTLNGGDPRAEVISSAKALLGELSLTAPTTGSAQSKINRHLVFDVSDLVAHFRNHRLPTGIQRVQIEVLAAALRTHGFVQIGICCFVDGRDHWIELPLGRFLKLAYLASSGSDSADPVWQIERDRLFFNLALDDPYSLPDRAILVNLGTSWWIYDYFRMVREAKEKQGISYIAMVYDLIPVFQPQYCIAGVTRDYVSWAVGVFQHADGYLAISESTKRDLLVIAAKLGHSVSADRVEVVALDADFRNMATTPAPSSALRKWHLDESPFALIVSTIEARKNHVLAFDAWAELVRIHGRDKLPRLVCVGRNGWLNDQAFARLAADAELRAHVTIIHQASDEELALLYRSCRFTVYPSHYEGWGLPVTESLCYGRVPVVADNSALPEAGGDLALMFEDDSVDALVKAVETVAFDDAWREARESRIVAEFRPRSWREIAQQINEAVVRLAADTTQGNTVARTVRTGAYYPTTLYRGLRIWPSLGSGEIFRAGAGWLWPEAEGCRTTLDGGELRMTVEGPAVPLRLYLLLRGLSEAVCPFTLNAVGRTIIQGALHPNERRWVLVDLPPEMGLNLSLTIKGEVSEQIEMSTGGTTKHLTSSLTVLGFALCARDDEEARTNFLEAAVCGDIDDISAYRDAVSTPFSIA